MSHVLIHFDEATLKAIDRIAPAAKRKRADFIRQAVKDAIFRQENGKDAGSIPPPAGLRHRFGNLGSSRRLEAMKQFEIWRADLPEPAGRRPVLLLARIDAYGYLSKFAAVEITSTIRRIAARFPWATSKDYLRSASPTVTVCAWFRGAR